MGASSTELHEDPQVLGPAIADHHRAIVSLMEELEAVDWYDQRVKASSDQELAQILAHNRDEEKEHAMMVLEWLRRHDAKLDEHMRTYLFTKANILEVEDAATGADTGAGAASSDGSLGIGSLRAGVTPRGDVMTRRIEIRGEPHLAVGVHRAFSCSRLERHDASLRVGGKQRGPACLLRQTTYRLVPTVMEAHS